VRQVHVRVPRIGDNGQVPTYRDEALVLRTQRLGEADRIITLLTRRHGRIRAVAKGVRRTSSRFGGRLEPFSRVDVLLANGRTFDIVTQADQLDAFGDPIVSDYPAYTAATAIAETCERLSAEEGQPALRLYLLAVGALRAVGERQHNPTLVLDAFVLRALTIAGYRPSLEACARCGEQGPHRAFALASGGSVCPSCRPAGSAAISLESLTLMSALLDGQWDVAEAATLPVRRETSGLVTAYLHWHLERGLRSLPLVERA
jgi:DNA repair protein RecO (recombination protein O)